MANTRRCWSTPRQPLPQLQSPTTQTLSSTAQPRQPSPSRQTFSSTAQPQQQPSPSSSQQQSPPTPEKLPPTLEKLIADLGDIKDSTILDRLIRTISKVLPEKSRQKDIRKTASSQIQDKNLWISSVSRGDELLKFVNVHTGNKEYIFSDSGEGTKVVTEILQRIGQAHWIVGGLCIVAYLVEKFEKVSENQRECFCLLNRMWRLATTVKILKDMLPEEENIIENAIAVIYEGSFMCISQMRSKKRFRFMKSSINYEKLKMLSRKIGQEYDSLNLVISRRTATHQPIMLPIKKPKYPGYAVGLKDPQEDVIQLLKLSPEHESPLAVVIYGVGGIGKTTLAEAVLAGVNLDDYLYARVYLEDRTSKKEIKEKQKIILNDAFPIYQPRELRDCEEGKEHLRQAFQSEMEPVFLFIDNVSESDDLKELLPTNLRCLPKRSRILLTTRKLDVTDILSERGLDRVSYAVKTLPDEEAEQILCKDSGKLGDNIKGILKICGGIPLVLRTVGANLAKMNFDVVECEILSALEKGKHIKCEKLSERVVDFVYKKFEPDTKAAFLDICCFFNGWYRRQLEYIFGKQQVKSLEEAGLLTSVVVGNEEGINAGEQKIDVRDIVRLRGRSISQSTRMMDYPSWKEATENKASLKKIKGVWIDDYSSELVLDEGHLNCTAKSLRILAFGDRISTTGQSSKKFNELRFLRVGNGKRQLPMQFEALDELRGYEGPIEGVSLYQLPKKLRKIKSDDTSFVISTEPNVTTVLEELRLLEFKCTAQLPEDVCRLSSLEKLSLGDSTILTRLPESFGLLKSLTHLDLSSCTALEDLPDSSKELRRLKHLILSGCSSLTNRSGIIEKLGALEYLDVTNCGKLLLDRSRLKNNLYITDQKLGN